MKNYQIFLIFVLVLSIIVIWYTCNEKHVEKDMRVQLQQKQATIDSLQNSISNSLSRIDTIRDTITQVRIKYKEREAAILTMTVPESTELLSNNIRTLADTLGVSLLDTLFLQVDSVITIQDTTILPIMNVIFERSEQFETIYKHQSTIISEYENTISDFSQIKAICDTLQAKQGVILTELQKCNRRHQNKKKALFWSLVGNAILVTILILK